MQRGKQSAEYTGQKRVERSLKNSDVKIVSFTEKFSLPCTMFIKEGVPEKKTCTFSVLKLFPGGEEKVIARKEVNLSMHFGEDFQELTVEMEKTKYAQGSDCKSITF